MTPPMPNQHKHNNKLAAQMPQTMAPGIWKTVFPLKFPLKVLNIGGRLPAAVFGSPLQLNRNATNLGRGPGSYSMSEKTFGRIHPLGLKQARNDLLRNGGWFYKLAQGEPIATPFPNLWERIYSGVLSPTWNFLVGDVFRPDLYYWQHHSAPYADDYAIFLPPDRYQEVPYAQVYSVERTIRNHIARLEQQLPQHRDNPADAQRIQATIARLKQSLNALHHIRRSLESLVLIDSEISKIVRSDNPYQYAGHYWALEGRKREILNNLQAAYNLSPDQVRFLALAKPPDAQSRPDVIQRDLTLLFQALFDPANVGKQIDPKSSLGTLITDAQKIHSGVIRSENKFGYRPENTINNPERRSQRNKEEIEQIVYGNFDKYFNMGKNPTTVRFTGRSQPLDLYTQSAVFQRPIDANQAARFVAFADSVLESSINGTLDRITQHLNNSNVDPNVAQQRLERFRNDLNNTRTYLNTAFRKLAALESGVYAENGRMLTGQERDAALDAVKNDISKALNYLGVNVTPDRISTQMLLDPQFVNQLAVVPVNQAKQIATVPEVNDLNLLTFLQREQSNIARDSTKNLQVVTTPSGAQQYVLSDNIKGDAQQLANVATEYEQSRKLLPGAFPQAAAQAEKETIEVSPPETELPVDINWWRKHMGFYQDAQYDIFKQVYKDPILRAKYKFDARLAHLGQLEQELQSALQNVVATGGYGSREYMLIKNRLEATRNQLQNEIMRARRDYIKLQNIRDQLAQSGQPVDEREVQDRFVKLDMLEDWENTLRNGERARKMLAAAGKPIDNWTPEALAQRWKQRWMERYATENMGYDDATFQSFLDQVTSGAVTRESILQPSAPAQPQPQATQTPQQVAAQPQQQATQPQQQPQPQAPAAQPVNPPAAEAPSPRQPAPAEQPAQPPAPQAQPPAQSTAAPTSTAQPQQAQAPTPSAQESQPVPRSDAQAKRESTPDEVADAVAGLLNQIIENEAILKIRKQQYDTGQLSAVGAEDVVRRVQIKDIHDRMLSDVMKAFGGLDLDRQRYVLERVKNRFSPESPFMKDIPQEHRKFFDDAVNRVTYTVTQARMPIDRTSVTTDLTDYATARAIRDILTNRQKTQANLTPEEQYALHNANNTLARLQKKLPSIQRHLDSMSPEERTLLLGSIDASIRDRLSSWNKNPDLSYSTITLSPDEINRFRDISSSVLNTMALSPGAFKSIESPTAKPQPQQAATSQQTATPQAQPASQPATQTQPQQAPKPSVPQSTPSGPGSALQTPTSPFYYIPMSIFDPNRYVRRHPLSPPSQQQQAQQPTSEQVGIRELHIARPPAAQARTMSAPQAQTSNQRRHPLTINVIK